MCIGSRYVCVRFLIMNDKLFRYYFVCKIEGFFFSNTFYTSIKQEAIYPVYLHYFLVYILLMANCISVERQICILGSSYWEPLGAVKLYIFGGYANTLFGH